MRRVDWSRVGTTALVALVFVQGVEMLRFQFASLGWYQRDTLGVATLALVPLALAPFLVGTVVPLASRILTLRAAIALGAVVLVVARVVNQAVAQPALDHWTSAVAVAAFVGVLSVLVGLGRTALVGGVLVGITFDAALKGLGSSLDLAYRPGWGPLAATVAIGVGIVFLSATVAMGERTGPRWGTAVTLLGIGPFLFVHYLILQSAGWTAEVAGTTSGFAAIRIVVLDALAVWFALRMGRSRVAGVLGALVVAGVGVTATGPSLVFDLLAIAAIPLSGPLWSAMVPDSDRPSLAPAATHLVGGFVLFLVLGLAYYLPLDLDLGFTQDQARLAGAALVVLFGLAASLRRAPSQESAAEGTPALAAVAVLLPVVGLMGAADLPAPPNEQSVRVMAYNIHQAFGTGGEMDVAAVASVIEDSGATVVGLQEVARGGLLNAGTDLLALLGERLGWEHVAFIGTTDPVWGNAILSRYPLGDVERRLLPTEGTLYRRGYLGASVLGPSGNFLFISTHLQQINDPDLHAEDPEADLYPVHTAQLATVVDQWNGRRPAVLVGDLNARPGWRQVEELLDAGWVDAWSEAGTGPGNTSNAADPQHRIDYVLHTPDLTVTDADVIESQASDHFAVVADLTRE